MNYYLFAKGVRIVNKIAQLNQRLALAINEKGYSQSLVAQSSNISRSLLNKYLKGLCLPKYDKLQLLALTLDVSPQWLEGYDVPKSRISYVAERLNESNSNERTISKTRVLKDGSFEHSSIKEKDLLKIFYEMDVDEFDDVIKYIALRTRK